MTKETSIAEWNRLAESHNDNSAWRRWGPYVADRAWGTVREDYSDDGDAWNHLTHDDARGTAYRWGEDGIAGICDRFQLLVFAPAFWNGNDPILKERLFGLTPFEGNHGEDVKEYYFHLDNTPTHSYMKFLLKYPQRKFPYQQLIDENRKRKGQGFEFELLDTGIFDENRYFDIFIEYAKYNENDLGIRIEAFNRAKIAAPLHIIPQLWFRNIWQPPHQRCSRPDIRLKNPGTNTGYQTIEALPSSDRLPDSFPDDYQFGKHYLHLPTTTKLMFTNNESKSDQEPFTKDAFHRHLINNEGCINQRQTGTKFGGHLKFPAIQSSDSVVFHCRLNTQSTIEEPLADIDRLIIQRKQEADKFYASIIKPNTNEKEKQTQRHALAGLFWTKQNYILDVEKWSQSIEPLNARPRKIVRNQHWSHLNSKRILSMPDKWEYPWFAAWDLAFHCVPFALADPSFAKEQLEFMLFEQFQHPNGQIPAYEWEFSDVNPPVHAWAVWKVFNMEKFRFGNPDYGFLERCFHKLLLNFTWWINKVDRNGNNIFEGGFLGLDNITVMDRSEPELGEAILEQADATGWMAMFAQQMMRMALELAKSNPVYEGLATKFFQHYVYIAAAMKKMGPCGDCQLWDETDGFFYDVLRFPDGRFEKFRVRSLVGLIPLFAVERLEADWLEPFAEFKKNMEWFIRNRPELVSDVIHTVANEQGSTHVLTVANLTQIQRILSRVWDENEFLSAFGIRSLSKFHQNNPFIFNGSTVQYEPAEAISKLKGGNSNWRGPIWFPTNYLLLDSLRRLGKAFGNQLHLQLPAFGDQPCEFDDLARDLANRLITIFATPTGDNVAWHGGCKRFNEDPHWKDLPLFHEYFHGDNGAGLGASHQTGWTALIANIIDEWRS